MIHYFVTIGSKNKMTHSTKTNRHKKQTVGLSKRMLLLNAMRVAMVRKRNLLKNIIQTPENPLEDSFFLTYFIDD